MIAIDTRLGYPPFSWRNADRDPMSFMTMMGHLEIARWLLEQTPDVPIKFLVQAVINNKTNRVSNLVQEARKLWTLTQPSISIGDGLPSSRLPVQ